MVILKLYSTLSCVFKMYNTGWAKVDVFLINFLQLWLKFRDGIDKYWIVPV